MSEGRCGGCAHWKTDMGFSTPIRVQWRDDEEWEDYDRREKERNPFAECSAMPFGPDVQDSDPVPLAVTMDGSGYSGTLYTQSDFGCVLFEPKDS